MKNGTTKERILEAALEVFSEKGLIGGTTRAIAARAGVAEMTLFRLFSSKERLVQEVLNNYSFLNAMKELLPDLIHMEYPEAMQTVARKILEELDRRKALFRVVHSESFRYPPRVNARYFSFVGDTQRTLASYLLDCQKKGVLRDFEPKAAAEVFLRMLTSFFAAECLRPPQEVDSGDKEERILEFVDIFVKGTLK
jgi:AcrR family transcriptional regulator